MKTLLIVYHSMTGGTQQLAQAAAAGAAAESALAQVTALCVDASVEPRPRAAPAQSVTGPAARP